MIGCHILSWIQKLKWGLCIQDMERDIWVKKGCNEKPEAENVKVEHHKLSNSADHSLCQSEELGWDYKYSIVKAGKSSRPKALLGTVREFEAKRRNGECFALVILDWWPLNLDFLSLTSASLFFALIMIASLKVLMILDWTLGDENKSSEKKFFITVFLF